MWLLVSEKIFLEVTRNKNCLWQPFLLTDRDELSIVIEDFP